MKKKQRSNNVDRISKLPEHMIHRILSFLPVKDVTRTTALSTAWRDVWLGVPNLNLGRDLLCPRPHPHPHPCYNMVSLRLRTQFFNFVDQTLTKRAMQSNINTTSVSLYVPDLSLQEDLPTILERWINIVINDLRVEELILEIDYFKKPPLKFTPNPIVVLPLKRLELGRVTISPEIMDCMCRNFPLMEKLCLFNCIIRKLKVSYLPKLTEFVFRCDGNYRTNMELKIDVPNLRFLEYKSTGDSNTVEMDTCRHSLRDLRLCRVSLSSHCCFSLLSNLELYRCKLDEKEVEISSKYLKTLSLYNCNYSINIKVKIDAPNLQYFNFSGESPAPLLFELNFLELKKAYFYWDDEVIDEWLLSFIYKFKPCKTLELKKQYFLEQMVIGGELSNRNMHSSLPDVKHMKLMFPTSIWSRSWTDPTYSLGGLMDTLLWICPCLSTITISLYRQKDDNEVEHKVFKFKYYKGYAELRCWQHHLAEVTIENRRTNLGNKVAYQRRWKRRAEQDDIFKSFFENARQKNKIIVNIVN